MPCLYQEETQYAQEAMGCSVVCHIASSAYLLPDITWSFSPLLVVLLRFLISCELDINITDILLYNDITPANPSNKRRY